MRTIFTVILLLITLSHPDDYTLDVNVTGIPDTITDSDTIPFTAVIENGTDNALLYDIFISAQLTCSDNIFSIPCEPTHRDFAISNKVKQFGGTLIAAELYDTIVTDTSAIREADSLKAIDTTMFNKKEILLRKIRIQEALYSSKKKLIKKRSVNPGIYTLTLKLTFKDRLLCQSNCSNRLEFPFTVVVKNKTLANFRGSD